jgi:hypothetical protein
MLQKEAFERATTVQRPKKNTNFNKISHQTKTLILAPSTI